MRHPALLAGAAAIAVALAGCATPYPVGDAYLKGFTAAEAAGRAFSPITDTQPGATLSEAYALQARLVAQRRARGDQPVGWRGSLMSKASMAGRGVSAPLVGVLYASGRVPNGGTVSLCGYRKASLELKLGFVFGQAVKTAPADAAALSGAVTQVFPVVDLPDIGYRDPDHYGAADMVASNISAASYVPGQARPPGGVDLNGLKVTLTRDGEKISEGFGRESLDDQWDSVLAVTRQIVATGRTVAPGDVLLTGRIGPRAWLPTGHYVADYGPLGTIAFDVRDCPKG